MVSTTRRMEGSGGKMYSFWAIYSLRMSFWMVPRSWSGRTPCFSAAARYIAQTTAAGELMVMLVETRSSGMPSSRISISLQRGDGHPALAELAQRFGGVGIVAHQGGQVEGDGEAGLALLAAGT